MNRNRNADIKQLKKLLKRDGIDILEAIDQFVTLLNEFEEDQEGTVQLDYALIASPVNRNLAEKNRRLKDKIKSLNRILVLQELGVTFKDEEITALLSQ